MELLKLSKFNLQLRALVTESRDLRKQKRTGEGYSRKLQELQAELASCNDLREKLERKVSYLQHDNALLENKQKEVKGTINGLLQSRDDLINAYQEASSVKQVVHEVQRVVNEREELMAKSNMDQVPTFEKVFVEKINYLENKLKNNEEECQRTEKIISELEAQLEVPRITNVAAKLKFKNLQKTVLAKDAVIQNLISEKVALHFQAGSFDVILQTIQNAVTIT